MRDAARIHHPVRSDYRIGEEKIYIDHSTQKSYWDAWKQWANEKVLSVRARYRHYKDTRTQSTQHDEAVERQLRRTGLSGIDLLKPEVRHIGEYLHKDEEILASMLGRNDDGGNGLLIVTDQRIMYLDVIPLFVRMDEVGHELVTGVSTEVGTLGAKVILHTGVKDFALHNVNPSAAAHFVGVTEILGMSRLTPAGT